MDINNTKEAMYVIYCKKCIHEKVIETEDPCNECLTRGWNENSHKPIKFEGKTNEKLA